MLRQKSEIRSSDRSVGRLNMNACVYILKSTICGSYYVGSASDIVRRFKEHNSGKVTSTKRWKPWDLAFFQEFPSLDKAKIIERKIKSWKRRDYIEKIIQDGFIKSSGSGSVG